MKTLHKSEFSRIIHRYDGCVPQVPNTKYFRACLERVETVDITHFQQDVLNELKKRGANGVEHITSESTPEGLKAVSLLLGLTPKESEYLSRFLDRPFKN